MYTLNAERLAENVDNIVQYDFLNNKVFGSAYYVYQEGNLTLERCYGTAALNANAPVMNTTLFRLASMTKPITAIAALILVDRGLLSLDDSVDVYLPQFKNLHIIDSLHHDLGAPKNLPTIRHLLSHTSGIGCDEVKLRSQLVDDRKTLDSEIAYITRSGLDFEPGSKAMYSPWDAFDVLVKIIEIVSGMDYLRFLEKEIFAPCNMIDTTFVLNADQHARLADMHTRMDGKNAVFEMPQGCIFENFPCTHFLGGAGLASSLRDYCNFSKMLLHKGMFEGQRILSEETFNCLCTQQVSETIMPGLERWGLGVRVIAEEAYPYLPVGTFGWSGAYGSHFWIDPVNNIFAVYMKNSKVDGGAGNESARKFEEAVYSSFL